jgi:hypothetical protein
LGCSNKLLFEKSLRKEVWWEKSGDRGGQRPRPTMSSPKNSCSEPDVFAVWTVAPLCPTPDMCPLANASCVSKCCYQSVYCCIIRYFHVRIRIAKCFTNRSRPFRCERTFCSRVETPYRHSFCAIGVSSGLVLEWPWLECHWGGCECVLYGGGPASDFILYRKSYIIIVGSHLNFTFCISVTCSSFSSVKDVSCLRGISAYHNQMMKTVHLPDSKTTV